MDTNQLRYFKAVADALNFTRAASNLYMSQTTLSYQISNLEKEIGVKLFNRGHAGVTLTASGKRLLEYVPRILELVDESIESTVVAGEGFSSSLRVGFVGTHEQDLLPYVVNEFNERYPDVDVSLRQGPPQRLLEMLKAKQLDLTFIISKSNLDLDGTTIDYFEKMPFYAIMRSDNELAGRKQLSRGEVAGQKLCFLSENEGSELNRHFIESFRKFGCKESHIDTSATMESVIMLIQSKGCVTIAPKCLMGGYKNKLVAVPMVGDDEFVYHGIAWRTDDENVAVGRFVEVVRDLVRQRESD